MTFTERPTAVAAKEAPLPVDSGIRISVVIPVLDEVESLRPLHESLSAALANESYELVFVDDGSSDGSVALLEELAAEDPAHVLAVVLRRNFGQTAAIAAGVDYGRGDIVVTIDADLQNDPADIPMLVDKLDEGFDVASGWRKNRQDKFLTRKLPSQVANWIISKVTGVRLHDYGCTLKAYRRNVLEGFRLYGEMHRFIPAYAGMVGARIVEMPVNHNPRVYGQTKYGLGRIFKVILDLFTVKFLSSYANNPIYLFGGAGLTLIGISFGLLVWLVSRRIVFDEHLVRSPLLLLTVMLFILGFQSMLLGLIAELQVRTYHESQAKPTYAVRSVLNGPSRESALG